MAVDRARTGSHQACCGRYSTRAGGRRGPLSTPTPTAFWPALMPGANGMTTGRARCNTTRRAHQRGDDDAHGGACGCQAAVPPRDAQSRDSLRFVR
jgi:hypothetical protein